MLSSLLFAVPKEPFRVSRTAKWTAYLQEVSPFQCSNTNSLVNLPVPWPPSQISTIFLMVTSDRGLRISFGRLGFNNHDQPPAPAFAITTKQETNNKQRTHSKHTRTKAMILHRIIRFLLCISKQNLFARSKPIDVFEWLSRNASIPAMHLPLSTVHSLQWCPFYQLVAWETGWNLLESPRQCAAIIIIIQSQYHLFSPSKQEAAAMPPLIGKLSPSRSCKTFFFLASQQLSAIVTFRAKHHEWRL